MSLHALSAEVSRFDLVGPAGNLPALRAAVDNGANCVNLGLRDATHARNIAALNVDQTTLAQEVARGTR